MTSRRVWATAAALALLVGGMQIRDALPSAAERAAAPFYSESTAPIIGAVEDVNVAATKTFNGTATNADWVVVDYQFVPEKQVLLGAEIEGADGTVFASANTVGNACGATYPGMRSECTLVFEMPAEQAEGAKLMFYVSNQMGPQLVVPLGQLAAEADVVRSGVWL